MALTEETGLAERRVTKNTYDMNRDTCCCMIKRDKAAETKTGLLSAR